VSTATGAATNNRFPGRRIDQPPVLQETTDAIGPLCAKSMSESPFNPVAPAFANALRDAPCVRFTEVPLTRDRVWLRLRHAGGKEGSVNRAS